MIRTKSGRLQQDVCGQATDQSIWRKAGFVSCEARIMSRAACNLDGKGLGFRASMWSEVSPYKSVILHGAVAELRNRYAGSGFGKLWNVFNPLAQIAVYAAVFSGMAINEDAPSVFVFGLCAGVITWLSFAETISRCTTTFVDNAVYLKKLALPELIYPLQSILAHAMVLGLSWMILAVIAAVSGFSINASWLVVPILLGFFLAFGAALGLLCGTVHAFFRDVQQGVGIGLQLWFWLSAVVTPATWFGDHQHLLRWNPAWWYLDAIKNAFVRGLCPSGKAWVIMLVLPLVAWMLALGAFAKLRTQIREVL